MRNFMQLLRAQWAKGKFLCIGLDSDAGRLPITHLRLAFSEQELLSAQAAYKAAQAAEPGSKSSKLTVRHRRILAAAQLAFNKQLVYATHDIVCAFKLNSAFYEALGPEGIRTLAMTISYIHQLAPGVVVILDFKRADIGNTNRGYVMALAGADAVTVNPYFGWEALAPFLDLPGWSRTSGTPSATALWWSERLIPRMLPRSARSLATRFRFCSPGMEPRVAAPMPSRPEQTKRARASLSTTPPPSSSPMTGRTSPRRRAPRPSNAVTTSNWPSWPERRNIDRSRS
jgi:orotidine-5'-phosphate decarboxylase